jgi:hypothetical protein
MKMRAERQILGREVARAQDVLVEVHPALAVCPTY